MNDRAKLILELDEALTRRIEDAARAEDRTTANYAAHVLKQHLDGHCPSTAPVALVLPFGLSPLFQTWVAESRAEKRADTFYITAMEGCQRSVYWAKHRYHRVEVVGSLPVDLLLSAGRKDSDFPSAIPLGIITGCGWDSSGSEYRGFCRLGYVDGNEPARAAAQVR